MPLGQYRVRKRLADPPINVFAGFRIEN